MFSNICLFGVLLTTAMVCVNGLHLKGVTLVNKPFVSKVGPNYEGYCVDLMNELSRIMNFTYTLTTPTDGYYGYYKSNGEWTGVIQELVMKRADFAVIDLTKTDERQMFIDFSEPFMDVELTALIRKDVIGNMTSFSDLANQSEVSYGYYGFITTGKFMNTSTDPTIMALQSHIDHNDYVRKGLEAVERVLNSSYAFIGESAFVEHAMSQNCKLTEIRDNKVYSARENAIGLQKGSPYKRQMDRAIRQLRCDGTLDRLKNKYFNSNCLNISDNSL